MKAKSLPTPISCFAVYLSRTQAVNRIIVRKRAYDFGFCDVSPRLETAISFRGYGKGMTIFTLPVYHPRGQPGPLARPLEISRSARPNYGDIVSAGDGVHKEVKYLLTLKLKWAIVDTKLIERRRICSKISEPSL
jgi:hypothetical protein